jgi:hypothetical protein
MIKLKQVFLKKYNIDESIGVSNDLVHRLKYIFTIKIILAVPAYFIHKGILEKIEK